MEIVLSHISFEMLFFLISILLCSVSIVSGIIIHKLTTPRFQTVDPNLPPVRLPSPIGKTVFVVTVTSVILISTVFGMAMLLTKYPVIISANPAPNALISSYKDPITIEFDVPVRINKLTMNAAPELMGEWKTFRVLPFLPVTRKIQFIPTVSLPPDQKILLYFSNLTPLIPRGWGSELLHEFYSPKIPKIVSVSPQNGSENVTPSENVHVTLSDPDGPHIIWEASFDPPIKYTIRRKSPKNLEIDYDLDLSQNTKYGFSLFATPVQFHVSTAQISERGNKMLVYEGTFMTVKAPLVSSFTPLGSAVLPNATLSLHFDEPMNRESVKKFVSISPPISVLPILDSEERVLTWPDASLAKETTYTVTVAKGSETKKGGKLESNVTYQFTTVGNVHVIDSDPKGDKKNVPIESDIRVTFDQPVMEKSAENAFTITPAVGGTFSWDKDTMIFHPSKSFSFHTAYVYGVRAGIESKYGMPSSDAYSVGFTTQPDQVVLPVPFLKQQELFTCNIAAARMILEYRGVSVPENELKTKVGYGGERGKGNPNKGYVTEYGTYWDALSKATSQYRQSTVYKDWKLDDIVAQISQGNPVLIWGQNGWSDPHDISWVTPDGINIHAVNGMHSYVVKGFRGSINNPTAIIVNDPWRGESVLSVAEFTRLYTFFNVAMLIK